MTSRCAAVATGSTQETKADRASKVAGLKLAQVVEGTDPLPKKPTTFAEFSERFLTWITDWKENRSGPSRRSGRNREGRV